jgi:glycosyltransferase involved in cell wall biosynthesis
MRVLHVIMRYAPAIGGAEVWCAEVAGWLHARGHAVDVLTLGVVEEADLWGGARAPERASAVGRLDVDGGVRVRRCALSTPAGGLLRLGQQLGLDLLGPCSAELFARLLPAVRRADVVHVHHCTGPISVAGVLAARLVRRPVVITPHYHPGDPLFDQRLTGWVLRRAHAVVVHTPWERALLVRRGVAPARIVTAPLALQMPSLRDAAERRARVRAGWGLGPETRVVTFVGRKSIQKSIPVLREAVARLARNDDVALALVGPSTPWFEVERRGWRGDGLRVIDVPAVPAATKYAVLCASDVLVQPSAREAFGIVFLEAWAAGLPVVGAANGAVPEVIGDGGLTFTPGDAKDLAARLASLFEHPAAAQAMATRGRERVAREHGIERLGAAVEHAYAIARPGRPPAAWPTEAAVRPTPR